jgi:hypothetical protein
MRNPPTIFDARGREETTQRNVGRVKAIMKVSHDKQDFWKKMDIADPKLNEGNLNLLPFLELPRLERPK